QFGTWIGWIYEKADHRRFRREFAHQLKPLRPDSDRQRLTPVTLPPGLFMLVTRPSWTGSPPVWKTIGIVVVAALAARPGADVTHAAMTLTWWRTRSAASAGNRSYLPSAHRYSIAMLRPST